MASTTDVCIVPASRLLMWMWNCLCLLPCETVATKMSIVVWAQKPSVVEVFVGSLCCPRSCALIVCLCAPIVVWIGTSDQCVLLPLMIRFLLQYSFRLLSPCGFKFVVCLPILFPSESSWCVVLLVLLFRLSIIRIPHLIVQQLLVFLIQSGLLIRDIWLQILLSIFLLLCILPNQHRRIDVVCLLLPGIVAECTV